MKSRRAAIQGVHDDVMRVLEEEVMREAPPDRRGVWDTKVRDLQVVQEQRCSNKTQTHSSPRQNPRESVVYWYSIQEPLQA